MKTIIHLARVCALLLMVAAADAQVSKSLNRTLLSPSTHGQEGAFQGYSVAIDGDLAVVGVVFDDTGVENAGVVKVYHLPSGNLLHVLPNPIPRFGDRFGASVSIQGKRVVVGAPETDATESSSGAAYVYDLGSSTPTIPLLTLTDPAPQLGHSFGRSVSISDALLVVGATPGAYVYDLSSLTPHISIGSLTNPGASTDAFGQSVAISGQKVVVGAPKAKVSDITSGRIAVFDLAIPAWNSPVHVIDNPAPAGGDDFGFTVAIDSNRIVVGAPLDDEGFEDSGTAYVFDLTSGTPSTPIQTLKPSPINLGDQFGYSVSIKGAAIAVGARRNDTGASNAGCAYLFESGSPSPSTPTKIFTNPTPESNDAFGCSVALSGNRMICGAEADKTAAFNAGSAYVYNLAALPSAGPECVLNHSSLGNEGQFGGSLATSGSILVVGAPYESNGAYRTGSVYVYDLSSATPSKPIVTIHNPDPESTEFFGFSVAVHGTRVVVGAHEDNKAAFEAGTAYVYDISSASPSVPIVELLSPSPNSGDDFGFSVAIWGDRVVVGAPGDDTAGTDVGRAYVYNLASATPAVAALVLNCPIPNDLPGYNGPAFGDCVAIRGSRILVGSPSEYGSQAKGGRTYAYDAAGANPTVPVLTIENPTGQIASYFGSEIALRSTYAVIAAPTVSGTGKVYAYNLDGATPATPIATFSSPAPGVSDAYGQRVAIAESPSSEVYVAISAMWDSSEAPTSGQVYVYDLRRPMPTVPIAILRNPTPADDDWFGEAIAVNGEQVFVGAARDDSVMPERGAVYVFGPPDGDHDGLLDAWEITHFDTTAGHGPLDDYDGDGRTELLELAFGKSPLVPDLTSQFNVVQEGGFLTVTIPKRAGVNYLVQSSGEPAASGFSGASTVILINDATTLKVRDAVQISAAQSRFLRVLVTAAP